MIIEYAVDPQSDFCCLIAYQGVFRQEKKKSKKPFWMEFRAE